MKTIDKINKLINRSYAVKISSSIEVHEDDYEKGEIPEVCNYWNNSSNLFSCAEDTLEQDISNLLLDYLEDELQVDKKYLIESLKTYFDNDYFYYSKFVDKNNLIPSEEQVKQWKIGEEVLYVQNIRINISINGTDITSDILLDIMKTRIA